ncbi:putative pyridoxamine 5'-phosphate oxidase family protein [Comamonas odontotermitis]|uniref:Pyridoxamine 5'-phosphate oxidase family protein n=1 Tax=Comamonas odontotermitis TaxID=379895 RepID=A0ABR6RKU8_9BURK|nr:hypothetical protein [Comamonas odontotermitis]MBB6579639.1 putative pyridoxamine 5'-phosphate oxidase family protein [Comamonas odontotermitis]
MKKYIIIIILAAAAILGFLYNSFLYTLFLTNDDVFYKVSRMIKDPEICGEKNKKNYSILKNINWLDNNLEIKEYLNAMPKRIDYKIINSESKLPIYHVVYYVDGGCDGFFISKE